MPSRLQPTGVSAEVVVTRGRLPEALPAEVARQRPDLIEMTDHGGHGPGYALFGGVAETVIAAGQAPVLLLRSDTKRPLRSLVGQKVVVLLDGLTLAETALPVALNLARVLNNALILFKAVGVYSVPYAVPTELMTVPGVDVQLA